MAPASRRGSPRPRSILKRFCQQCKALHTQLVTSMTGNLPPEEQSRLALFILLRMATLYFLQSTGLLANDPLYIRHQLKQGQQDYDPDMFYRRTFLPLLQALTTPETTIHPHLPLPLLNPLPLEISPERSVNIPDNAFRAICDLFDTYTWQLAEENCDASSLRPVVLACLYEQYINQKQIGAYYTSEDVTNYIASNTLIPSLFHSVASYRPSIRDLIASTLRAHSPSRYLPPSLQYPGYLPRETSYEHNTRITRLAELERLLINGDAITTPDDIVTHNLNTRQWALDVLAICEDVETLLAFYGALEHLRVLDPTCGCGAFLCAALSLLKSLYTVCLQRLRAFAPDPRCQGLFAQVERHPSQEHFILTTILTHNLYGVDLLEDATLICQTRLLLFLLTCAPRDTPPPLPNLQPFIRSGDVLHGDIHPLFDQTASLPRQYSGTPQSPLGYKKFLNREKPSPFHWYQAFPHIMAQGGFDVVLGNPPYLELHRARSGKHMSDSTYGNLYAEVLQRSLCLTRSDQGFLGLLVPLSICGSARFSSLRATLRQSTATLWLANFEIFPCRLFEEAFQRLTLLIARRDSSSQSQPHHIHVTRLQRWYTSERPHLIELMRYTSLPPQTTLDTFPKLGGPLHVSILRKLDTLQQRSTLDSLLSSEPTAHFVYYQEATNYWLKAVCHIPFYRKDGSVMTPPHGRFLYFPTETCAYIVMALMNSSLFYLWFATHSDGFHLAHTLVKAFPLPSSLLSSQDLAVLARVLEADILNHARYSTRNTRVNVQHLHQGLHIELMEYHMARSRPLLDQVDELLARFYGFTAQELAFILHYDQKYRSSPEEI